MKSTTSRHQSFAGNTDTILYTLGGASLHVFTECRFSGQDRETRGGKPVHMSIKSFAPSILSARDFPWQWNTMLNSQFVGVQVAGCIAKMEDEEEVARDAKTHSY